MVEEGLAEGGKVQHGVLACVHVVDESVQQWSEEAAEGVRREGVAEGPDLPPRAPPAGPAVVTIVRRLA